MILLLLCAFMAGYGMKSNFLQLFTLHWTVTAYFNHGHIFYVLLTVHLGIILVNDQFNAQFFYICLFQISTCFQHSCAHHRIVSIRCLVNVTLCRGPSGMQIWVCCGWRTPPTTQSNQFQLFHDSGRQQYGVTVTRCCSYSCLCFWRWVIVTPETCRAVVR
jgi:hypothetical protein